MSIIKQTKVLRLKMDLPLSLWRELDFAMELNPDWAKRILRLSDWRPADLIHDINGILKDSEFFLPKL